MEHRTKHLKVLGLSRGATISDIKKAYRALIFQWHPDKNKDPDSEEKTRDIQTAYAALTSTLALRQQADSNHTIDFSILESSEPNEPSYHMIDPFNTIYYVRHRKYLEFISDVYPEISKTRQLKMDLAQAETHTLIIAIDFSHVSDMFVFVHENLKLALQGLLPKIFTMLCSRRNKQLYVHVPEIVMGHDDYIVFCSELKKEIDTATVKIRIPEKLELPSSNLAPYLMIYLDKKCLTVEFDSETCTKSLIDAHNDFIRKKGNENNVFREILGMIGMTRTNLLKRVLFYMMPVVVIDGVIVASYTTQISVTRAFPRRVASFSVKNSQGTHEITKCMRLNFKGEGFNVACQYIKSNCLRIYDFVSDNCALNAWFKMHKSKICVTKDHFQSINQTLVDDNKIFTNDVHPLKTILEYNSGYYFIPVFFALCKCMKHPPIQELLDVFKSENSYIESLLHRLSKVGTSILMDISQDFSINTILYCGSNMTEKIPRFTEKLTDILTKCKPMIDSCQTNNDMVVAIKKIMDRYIPIITATLKNSCKKPTMYLWNIVQEQWQEIKNERDITHIVQTIRSNIGMLYSHTEDIPCSVPNIVSAIASESNMDRVTIAMDQHKWSVKTPCGVLDLLTGHVGGTVPEFYLSENHMNIELERQELIQLRTKPNLSALHKALYDRVFFQDFLQALFEDETDDFLETLTNICQRHGVFFEDSRLATSMLNFYVHLCKYVSFEFDLLVYLTDVLSSTLVSTNYYRHFFIIQGETGNGKSKLFEILQRVFGTYCAFIRNINVQTQNFATHPELATHLFNKRIVQIEEMSGKINENLIKEITGNSNTSFRSLYEQNVGGVPTAKIFTTTNNPPNCTATKAFEERVMTFPFDSKFVKHLLDKRTSAQVANDVYQGTMSDNIVNDSHMGLFVILYLQWFDQFNPDTGFLELKPEPSIMSEFKEHYLSTTSMYNQFKQFADIQIVKGEATTLTDVVSAVRQFLNETKRVNVNQDDIIKKFEIEYKKHKHLENEDECMSMSAMDESDDDEPPTKKRKKDTKTLVVYKNVAIRNLKRKFGLI